MPCVASATVVGHLYKEPKSGSNDGKAWAAFNFWTSDKIKPKGGDAEKKFTSWSGIVNGPQAEWLTRDGKKGSLICVTGTIRIDTRVDKDGKTHAFGEFVRVQEARILDVREEAEAQPVPKPQVKKPYASNRMARNDEESAPF